MRKHLAVVGLFLALAITGVMTLTLTSNDTTPVRGKALQLSCLTSGESPSITLIWFNPQNVKLSTCFTTLNGCSGNTSSYSFTIDNSGGYAYINSLSRENDTGTWKCVYGLVTATIEIKMYSIPSGLSITQNPDQDVDLSVTSAVLQCKTVGCAYPVPTVQWIFKDRSTLSETEYATVSPTGTPETCTSSEMVFTSTLQLPRFTTFNDNSDKSGTFYCRIEYIDTTKNIISSLSKNVRFAVYVKSITMSSSGSLLISPLIFLEGQEKRIQCVTSPSRPRPQVRWWLGTEQVLNKITESESSSGNLIVTTNEISLTLNRSHTHKVLYCDAAVLGQQTWISSTKSNVTVQYAPDVRVKITGSTVVGFTAVLMCTAQGEPSQYTFHPWIHRVGQTEIRWLNGEKTDIISNLTLSNISIQDMGSYICTVNNSITGLDGQLYQTGDTSVYVQGRPIIDKIQTTFTGEPFKPIRIQIPFYSHTSIQKLTFIKQIGSQEILNTSDISSYIQPTNITMMFYNKKVMIPGYTAVLQFRNLTERDFCNYTLTLTNVQGSETMQFELIASVTPEKPINFHATNIQERQLSLMWQSGYHGRFPQTFVVETSQDNITWTNVSLVSDGNRDGWFATVIDNFNPGSKYFFRLYGYNKHGRGEFADVQLAIRMWKESTNTQSIEDSTLLGIGVGAGVGGVVLGCIGAIVVVTFRRRLNGSKCSFFRSKDKTDDVTYLNTEMTSQPIKPIYEELNKGPVEHNMYDKIEHIADGT